MDNSASRVWYSCIIYSAHKPRESWMAVIETEYSWTVLWPSPLHSNHVPAVKTRATESKRKVSLSNIYHEYLHDEDLAQRWQWSHINKNNTLIKKKVANSSSSQKQTFVFLLNSAAQQSGQHCDRPTKTIPPGEQRKPTLAINWNLLVACQRIQLFQHFNIRLPI